MILPADSMRKFRAKIWDLEMHYRGAYKQKFTETIIQEIIDETALAMLKQEQCRLDAHAAVVNEQYEDMLENREANVVWNKSHRRKG